MERLSCLLGGLRFSIVEDRAQPLQSYLQCIAAGLRCLTWPMPRTGFWLAAERLARSRSSVGLWGCVPQRRILDRAIRIDDSDLFTTIYMQV